MQKEQILRNNENSDKESNKFNESKSNFEQNKDNNTNWEDVPDNSEENKKTKIANLIKHLLGVWRVRK